MNVNRSGSALGPINITIVLNMIQSDNHWVIDDHSITFEGGQSVSCKILTLTQHKMGLESIVEVDSAKGPPILFTRKRPASKANRH